MGLREQTWGASVGFTTVHFSKQIHLCSLLSQESLIIKADFKQSKCKPGCKLQSILLQLTKGY